MTGRNDEMVTLSFESITAETEAAWLVCFDGENGPEAWLPKSQCNIDVDAGKITAPQWLVEAKEIEDYVD